MTSFLSLMSWPDPLFEFLGFLAAFFATGPIGLRYAVLGRSLLRYPDVDGRRVAAHALVRAGWFGVVGVVVGALLLAHDLPGTAAERHTTVGALLATNLILQVQIVTTAVALVGFLLTVAGSAAGWPIAAIGVVAGALRGLFAGNWLRIVNPMHMLAAGFWIGTLFVMLVCAFPSALGKDTPVERRGRMVADLVNAFSPFALCCAGVLVTFGVITAWRHLKFLAALWTTPYGEALVVKLCVVAAVVGVGAWNWRRQRPRLGGEDGALAIRRSARAEVTLATLVLLVTAVLVSLPEPKKPGEPEEASAPPRAPAPVSAVR